MNIFLVIEEISDINFFGTDDRSQTDLRTSVSGVQKRTISNFNADGAYAMALAA